MDYKLPIRLKIADREYPMQVDAAEEAMLRSVGKEINTALKHYREEFEVDNYQDMLAMFAVDCMMGKKNIELSKTELENIVLQKINSIEEMINSVL